MSRHTKALLVILLVVIGILTTTAVHAQPATEKTYIIVTETGVLPANLGGEINFGGDIIRILPDIGIVIATSTNPDFDTQLEQLPGVRAVIPDRAIVIDRDSTFNAPANLGTLTESGEDDFFFNFQWGHDAINAPEAWSENVRGAGVRVAVLDDGIDSDHPDIAPNLNTELSTSFVPDETFEYVEQFPGDPFSHGTHVAGVIGAADNGLGIIGVAPEAELVMVKVISAETGETNFEWLISGIMYAADIGADVINLSLGADFPLLTSEGKLDFDTVTLILALARVTHYAQMQGATIIASAGDDGRNGDADFTTIRLPSDLPHVLSISATGPTGWALNPETNLDAPANDTNYGRSRIDLAAPGGNIDPDLQASGEECTLGGFTRPCWAFDLVFSTGSAGAWYWVASTDQAAAYASGVAALIIGQTDGHSHPALVRRALIHTADDLGEPGRDAFYGWGRVNAEKAVLPFYTVRCRGWCWRLQPTP